MSDPDFPCLIYDGVRCRIVQLLDVDGDELSAMPDDPSEVHAVLAERPDGKFIAQLVGPEMWMEK